MEKNNIQSDNDFIGLTKNEAFKLCEQRGLKYRVIMEDDEPFIVTMDLKFDRINFHVQNNLVISQKRG